ncbi:hypothetical protein BC332_03490 [Capsicum chinense]|nr:hypothetical protein BC332_03490 [Capsicum chinense]
MQPNGVLQLSEWNNQTANWDDVVSAPTDTYPTEWARGNWSKGCVRKTSLNRQKEVKFLKYSGIKLPDTHFCWYSQGVTLNACDELCLRNCSYMAHANPGMTGKTEDCCFGRGIRSSEMFGTNESKDEELDLPLFDFETISHATNNFSLNNKLGEGSFGPAYKQCSEDRPSMASAVLMLGSDVVLPLPKEPDLFNGRSRFTEADSSSSKHCKSSINEDQHLAHSYLECEFRYARYESYEVDIEVRLDRQAIIKRDGFKYLRSLIHESGDINNDVTHRIAAAWIKWRLVFGVLCDKKVSQKF